jgi:hypothetical protein
LAGNLGRGDRARVRGVFYTGHGKASFDCAYKKVALAATDVQEPPTSFAAIPFQQIKVKIGSLLL